MIIVTNHVFIITPLPYLALAAIYQGVDAPADRGFKCPDTGSATTPLPACRTCPRRGTAYRALLIVSVPPQDAMEMVGHYREFI